MGKLRKENYITEETKQLNEQYKQKVKEDRERAYAIKIVNSIPEERKQYVLEILSRELASKGNAK